MTKVRDPDSKSRRYYCLQVDGDKLIRARHQLRRTVAPSGELRTLFATPASFRILTITSGGPQHEHRMLLESVLRENRFVMDLLAANQHSRVYGISPYPNPR